jgi:methylenetetrahydrofolate dehydrogenase (NADP+)/methenyltetrahydrofolate cyclohydrolase
MKKHNPHIIDGDLIARSIITQVRRRIATTRRTLPDFSPRLGIIVVGAHPASEQYVAKKTVLAERLGCHVVIDRLPLTATTDELRQRIRLTQRRVDGIIVQLPLPSTIDTPAALDALDPHKDIDVLSPAAQGTLLSGKPVSIPPTPGAIMEILRRQSTDLRGKHVVIIGSGQLVGRPLAALLMHEPVTLTIVKSATRGLAQHVRRGDIVIAATGKSGLITSHMIKPGAIVIDAGISVEDGVTHGDVDAQALAKKASWVTPTPGGVGPVTVALLLRNLVDAASQKIEQTSV